MFPVCRARRAAKEAKEAPAQPAPEKVKVEVKKFVKIGRPGYKGEWGWRPARGWGPWHRTQSLGHSHCCLCPHSSPQVADKQPPPLETPEGGQVVCSHPEPSAGAPE